MSIIEPGATTIGPEPVAAPVEEAREAPSVETPETPEVDQEATFDQLPAYWQNHIKEKRDAEARYRTEARDYTQAFDGYDDDTASGWLQLIQLAKEAPD